MVTLKCKKSLYVSCAPSMSATAVDLDVNNNNNKNVLKDTFKIYGNLPPTKSRKI